MRYKIKDIRVFLYNCDSFKELVDTKRETYEASPHIDVEGRAEYKGKCLLKVDVINNENNRIVSDEKTISLANASFSERFDLEDKLVNPNRIVVTFFFDRETFKKEVKIKIHKVRGRITDFFGRGVEGYVCAMDEQFNDLATVKSDKEGFYEFPLPERYYLCLASETKGWSKDSLETWAWELYIDRDIKINFRIGGLEIYRLTAWQTIKNTILMDFVVFSLSKLKQYHGKNNNKVILGGDPELYPHLKKEDIKVFVDDREVEIKVLHSHPEYIATQKGRDVFRPAYLIEVLPPHLEAGRHAVRVVAEYRTENENGKSIVEKGEATFNNLIINDRLGRRP